jgi:hypothetical protein
MIRVLCLIAVVAPALCGGCAAPQSGGPAIDAAKRSDRPEACDAELRAFVAVTRLAKLPGEEWSTYEPALEALKEQILDCVQDSYGSGISI